MTPQRVRAARRMLDESESTTIIAEALGVSRATIYRHVPQE